MIIANYTRPGKSLGGWEARQHQNYRVLTLPLPL